MNDEDYKNKDILDLNYSDVYKCFYELGILNADLLKIASCKFKEITGNLTDSAKTSDLGIDNLSVLNQNDAGKAIDACDNAINKIS